MRGFWRREVTEPLEEIDREVRPSRGVDVQVMVVLVTAAICLTLQEYCFTGIRAYQNFAIVLGPRFLEAMTSSGNVQMNQLLFWFAGCVAVQLVIPALVVKLVLRDRLREYGIKLGGFFSCFWIYVLMLAVCIPLVLLASGTARFQETYPYYRLAPGEPLWPNFWAFKGLHALQFFSLEFFYRGFLVHGTRHRFGRYAVFVMMVPYCMIHFGKPMPETFASILAALGLGFMSLKTRSIWMGTAVHVSVALAMDLAALWRAGYFA